ncbi:DnaJ domain containing protein [Nitzschia inconspicua]|uniref:DnaJ domain containing protein n=1 Tax=Nitzschia inconspicua TaxID=303405 RepID=A0A9K3LN15_9STRA|nr:DnaJ domain containing protein [Nitzschia inconspicua]
MLKLGASTQRRRGLEIFPSVQCIKSKMVSKPPKRIRASPSCHSCQFFSSYHNDSNNWQRRQRSSLNNQFRIKQTNPYDVLGIPRDSSVDTVKRKFLQLALRHHPDTNRHSSDDSNRSLKSNTDTFVKIRQAFERIKQDFSSRRDIDAATSSSSWFTEEEFDSWFYEETGQKMDASTRREVMHVYRSGLTRTEYGAVWEIAFILEEEGFFTQKEKTLPDLKSNSSTGRGRGEKENKGKGKLRGTSQPRRKRSF